VPAVAQTILLLILSNVFMTFAWYYHLKPEWQTRPLYVVIALSWGIALFEYILQVPANRIGHQANLELPQLKIMQEVITLSVFVPFALYVSKQQLRLDFLWAALCMCGAVYFVFRGGPLLPPPGK
jgi:uncharacterized protein (DUF486 family)